MKYTINKDLGGPLYITEEDQIKLNSNCPDSEKTGTGPGSCGRGKDKESTSKKTPENTKSIATHDKAILSEQSGRNRFVVTLPDGSKEAFENKDFAELAMKEVDAGRSIAPIKQREVDLMKKVRSQNTTPRMVLKHTGGDTKWIPAKDENDKSDKPIPLRYRKK